MIAKVLLALDALSAVSAMSAGVRTALLALLGLLGAIFACLVGFVFVIRRRPRHRQAAEREQGRAARAVSAATRAAGGAMRAQAGATRREAGVAHAVEDPMVCPACRRELEPGLTYCPHDATRLVPAPAMLEQEVERQRKSRVCPRCHRAFQGRGVSYCPHDGSDLVPMGLHQAVHALQPGHDAVLEVEHEHDGDGVTAKICPACRGRYDFAATFCGKDGAELVVLN